MKRMNHRFLHFASIPDGRGMSPCFLDPDWDEDDGHTYLGLACSTRVALPEGHGLMVAQSTDEEAQSTRWGI
jgi:hypothetical protein